MAKLTDKQIEHMKPTGKPLEIPDSTKGLYLWIGATGAKSFVVRYRAGGKSRKLTLGKYPAITLAEARKLAGDAMLAVSRGGDPAGDKKAAKRAARAQASNTFEHISRMYMELEGRKLRSAHDLDRMLRTRIWPDIGSTPIALLKKSQVVALLDTLTKERGPVSADRCLGLIRRIINWYTERADDDYRPPMLKFKPRKTASEGARARILDDRELRAVWTASEGIPVFGAFVRLLLLTAARRNELAKMQWSEINERGVWRLPAIRNKTAAKSGKAGDLDRPLSKLALSILQTMPRIPESPYVFSLDGWRPISGFSKPKARLDERVEVLLAAENGEAGRLPLPIPNWTLHDLRRTARSLMSRAHVPERHAEACLGHVVRGVGGTYDRYDYQPEMARAYEMLAAEIEKILKAPTAPADNVVVWQFTAPTA
jgi:integrase